MKAPHFWSGHLDPQSREAAPLTRALLTPLAGIYAGITARRIRTASPTLLNIPVICIGNLTAGGSGKTPIAAAIRTRLSMSGLRTATLSRGYGGRLSGPLRVDPSKHTSQEVGDEPLMLALLGEAWIAHDRADGGEAMEADGVDVIVMDDGFQNSSLGKDLSLLVIDTDDPVGNGYVIPKGPLREPVSAGLARAHGIVLTGDGACPAWLENAPIPILRSRLIRSTEIPSGALIAFAGLASPNKFFDALARDGANLADTVAFPDHHPYSDKDMALLRKLAADHDAGLVTTEKDIVRLTRADQAGIDVIRVTASFDDEAALDELLDPLANKALA
ncbi:MAG: tetraacyldisaccharide 4'-kinase [Pseudomonadota bacterium]